MAPTIPLYAIEPPASAGGALYRWLEQSGQFRNPAFIENDGPPVEPTSLTENDLIGGDGIAYDVHKLVGSAPRYLPLLRDPYTRLATTYLQAAGGTLPDPSLCETVRKTRISLSDFVTQIYQNVQIAVFIGVNRFERMQRKLTDELIQTCDRIYEQECVGVIVPELLAESMWLACVGAGIVLPTEPSQLRSHPVVASAKQVFSVQSDCPPTDRRHPLASSVAATPPWAAVELAPWLNGADLPCNTRQAIDQANELEIELYRRIAKSIRNKAAELALDERIAIAHIRDELNFSTAASHYLPAFDTQSAVQSNSHTAA